MVGTSNLGSWNSHWSYSCSHTASYGDDSPASSLEQRDDLFQPWKAAGVRDGDIPVLSAVTTLLYIYIYIYVCTYIYIHTKMYLYIYICVCVCVCVYMHIHMYIYMCKYTHVYIYIYYIKYIYKYIYLSICTCIYLYRHPLGKSFWYSNSQIRKIRQFDQINDEMMMHEYVYIT